MNETVQSSLAPTQLVNPLTEDKSTLGANLAPVPA